MTKSTVALWCVMASFEAPAAFAVPELELRVYLSDCVHSSEDLLAAVRDEVAAIFAPTGVRVVWLAEPPDPEKAFDARVYLLDELLPSLRATMRITTASEPMGITLGRYPTTSAAIYVSRKAVLTRVGRRYPLVRNNMARVIGRTIAHELAHRFLGPAHTEQGILRPIFSEWGPC